MLKTKYDLHTKCIEILLINYSNYNYYNLLGLSSFYMYNIKLKLINIFCFCILCGGHEKKIIPATDITATEYIKWKKRNKTDFQIYELTGYHY